MTAQFGIHAFKRTLLVTIGTVGLAFCALASTATAACHAYGFAAVTAGRALPAVQVTGTYGRVHPARDIRRADRFPEVRIFVNTSGVASRHGVLVRTDGTGHAVNAKGMRVGGRTLDS